MPLVQVPVASFDGISTFLTNHVGSILDSCNLECPGTLKRQFHEGS
jgi:hypothetical protein